MTEQATQAKPKRRRFDDRIYDPKSTAIGLLVIALICALVRPLSFWDACCVVPLPTHSTWAWLPRPWFG